MKLESVEIKIVNSITSRVVALVQRHACLTTKCSRLFFRLDSLSTREGTSRRDTYVEERTVVGTAIKRRGSEVLSSVGEVVLEELLELGRSGRTADVERAAVSIVNGVDVVW